MACAAGFAAGRFYQAWKLTGRGNPMSLGVLPAHRGVTALEADLSDATGVPLSVEPARGSSAPGGEPVLGTQF